jgi:predicted small metal-binding protein
MQAADHAKSEHNLAEISPEMMTAVRGAIHDDDQAEAASA